MPINRYDECYFINYDSYNDLNILETGRHKCPPCYSFGPVIRDNYILHYVLEGNGVLHLKDKIYPITAEQLFIIPSKMLAFYKADSINPWHYVWVHFNGQKAAELVHKAGLFDDSPIFIPKSQSGNYLIEECMTHIPHHNHQEYECIGYLYHLFQILTDTTSYKPALAEYDKTLLYIKTVINFIANKYSEPITIQDIADFCNLDRSYLCKIFKHATNYSPKEYLIFFRIKKAKQLLKKTDMSIQYIAYSVGYKDAFNFSKLFKKKTGLSPVQYREKYLSQQNIEYPPF